MKKNVLVSGMILGSLMTGCIFNFKKQPTPSNQKFDSGAVTETFFKGEMQVRMPMRKNNVGGLSQPEIFKTPFGRYLFTAIKENLDLDQLGIEFKPGNDNDAQFRLPVYRRVISHVLQNVSFASQQEKKEDGNFCLEATFANDGGSAKICLVTRDGGHFAYGMIVDGPGFESYTHSLKIN